MVGRYEMCSAYAAITEWRCYTVAFVASGTARPVRVE